MAQEPTATQGHDLKSMFKKLSAGASYRRMLAAHQQGRPICVASAAVPVEVLYAMDVHPVFPESLAAIAAGIRKADEFFDAARQRGFSNSVCSYTRCGLGIAWSQKCAFGPIPEPDLFVTDVSVCCLHVTWWAYLEDHFRKPTYYMDMPATDDPWDPDYISYYEEQIRGLVRFIEENTSSRLEMERLKEAVRQSDLAGLYWKRILELRKKKPSPVSFRSLAGEILPLVTALGEKECADFYLALYEFYSQQASQGSTPAQGGEHYRLIWNGIPIWHHLQVITYFEEKGANFVWEPYTALSWGNKTPSGRLDPEAPFRTLAEKYTNVFTNMPIERRFGYFDQAIREYGVDGLVMFSNRSCRPQSIGQDEVVELVRERHDLPVLIFEGDQADPEGFSMQEAKTRIDGFLEVLEARRRS
ncbi:MAG: 2-hydroxyacyl-CoA dehydratase subunit D [Thermodesulfobacteriota bacterium]